jgi:2-desacetyl-2-hydroxyethyl bacteriochlorophyllide A dehydrogenase
MHHVEFPMDAVFSLISNIMNTLVCKSPGHFEYDHQPYPQLREGHSIVKIKRVGICGTDLHAFEGTQPFFSYPRVLGHELAAEYEEGNAEGFVKGDQLTIIPYIHCGTCIACRQGKTNCCASLKVLGVHTNGGMSEYFLVPDELLLHGAGLSMDALALVEPLCIGYHAVQRSLIKEGNTALVVGAGPIGFGLMLFLKAMGVKVIGMDTNPDRLQFCNLHLNIDVMLHPAEQDVFEKIKDCTSGDMPSVVFDATGNGKAINNAFRFMSHAGTYVLVGLQMGEIHFSHPEFHKREGTLMSSRNATRKDFEEVMQMIRDRSINPLVMITHRMNFEELGDRFSSLMDPAQKVVKAMVSL